MNLILKKFFQGAFMIKDSSAARCASTLS
jgi:hypothetical protein